MPTTISSSTLTTDNIIISGTITSYSFGGLTYWCHDFTSSGTFTA